MSKVSEICRTVSKGLTFVSLESQKERKRLAHKKIFEDILAKNILNLVKDVSLQNQEA